MRRSGLVALAGIILSMLTTATVAARIDPCLLTADDLHEVLGFEFVEGDEYQGLAECEYTSVEDDGGGAAVGILLSESATKREAKSVFNDQRFIATDTEAIDGVGNRAFYSGDLGDVVVFRKGTTVVSLTLLVLPQEPHREELIKIARIAARNI